MFASTFGSPHRFLRQKNALQSSSRKQYNYNGYRQISKQQDIHPNIRSITYFKDDNFCYKSFYERENKHRGKRAFFDGITKQIKTLFGGRQLKFGSRKPKKFSTTYPKKSYPTVKRPKVPTVTYRKVVRKTGLPVPTNQGTCLI